MLIGIDAHSWGLNLAGNETYTFNLLHNLAKVDEDNIYRIYLSQKGILKEELFKKSNFEAKLIRPCGRWLRMPLVMPVKLLAQRIDLLHVQYFSPPICPCKLIVTVHDVSFRRFPQWFTGRELFMFNFIARTLKKAESIIAVSEFTKREIINHYNVSKDKIAVIYNGVDRIFRPITDLNLIHRIKRKHKVPCDFILHVGRINIRKNIPIIIRAFKMLKERGIHGYKLVLAGEENWKCDNIKGLIKQLAIEEEIIFTGYIPQMDLPALYSAARLFVSPSFYEGFGLAPLEAMACGIPVVTSDTTAFPEILEDAATMVDPYNTEELAETMRKLLSDEDLREKMILKGLRQVKKFNWEKTARETLKIYKEIDNGR